MINKLIFTFVLLLGTNLAFAVERIDLFVGEIKILKPGGIERIAIGKPDVVSNSMLQNGQLLLIAEAPGTTTVKIWLSNGREIEYVVLAVEKANNLIERKNQVEKLLADVEGLNVNIVGDKIVLSGIVAFGYEDTIKTIQESYDDILSSINFAVNDLVRKKNEIEELLSEVDGLTIRIVGEKIVLSGLIDNGYDQNITTIQGAYPELMDLTQRGSLDMDMPDNKMVLMNIKITEFSKDFTDTLGIAWSTSAAGPTAGFAFDAERNSTFIPSVGSDFSAGDLAIGVADSPLGYFGIATEITSRINFAVSSGDAVILAEPRLAARSGGEATFLSGGEFPIEISNVNGTTVEFKSFGIQLDIVPEIDHNNNIKTKVSTELSSINLSNAVNGIPGLDTRKTEADVLLRDGETLVMSGLLNQVIGKTISGIKYLMDIPILGRLFRSETFLDNESELVIFVTPQIFDSSSQVNRDAEESVRKGIENVINAIDKKSLDIIY
jgi:pilus assembly protein CpaC